MFSAPALSLRLQALFDLPAPRYDAVWDLCCDHGHLGLAFLSARRAKRVHFVDQVASIMATLTLRIEQLPADAQARAHLHASPAESLQPAFVDSQLFVLAGVGGDKTLDILNGLAHQPGLQGAHWLLSPANDVFQVRHWLHHEGFRLLAESAVTEQKRCYELLWVCRSDKAHTPISTVGEAWQPGNAAHERYLYRLQRHYRNCLRSPNLETVRMAELALAAYQPLFAQIARGQSQ